MRKATKYPIALLVILLLPIVLSNCVGRSELDYYTKKDNYISVTAEISFVNVDEENTAIYLGFSDLSDDFADNCFKIVGENWKIIRDGYGTDIFSKGKEITFITAPKYFGDGYVMPIVAVAVEGEEILPFKDGYNNFIDWLEQQ